MPTFEEPLDDATGNKAVLTDGLTYIEFRVETDDIAVDKNHFEFCTDRDNTDDLKIVNSSTNDDLPEKIPRIRMSTPFIQKIGILFRMPDEGVIKDSKVTFCLKNSETGEIEASQEVIFTEVLSSGKPPEEEIDE